MNEVCYCKNLDKLYNEAMYDVSQKEGVFCCWFPTHTEEFRAIPLHTKWQKKFEAHKKKCEKCILNSRREE